MTRTKAHKLLLKQLYAALISKNYIECHRQQSPPHLLPVQLFYNKKNEQSIQRNPHSNSGYRHPKGIPKLCTQIIEVHKKLLIPLDEFSHYSMISRFCL